MPFVEITFNVVAGGGPRKPGDRLELSGPEARLLVGSNRARFIQDRAPVVITQEPAEAPKPVRKRKAKAPKEGGDAAPDSLEVPDGQADNP
jgi:hypothetical protein